MDKIFLFGIHNHQPVGNFDEVFLKAYELSYKPLLEELLKNEHIKFALHTSGCLIDWLEENKPEYFEIVSHMVKRNQVEILTGAYYEPIIPSIPEEDAYEQIMMMNEFIVKKFGVEPVGMWLPERVWEPHLPKILSKAGVKYIAVDDSHFKHIGVDEDSLYTFYTTENEGYTVYVLPILKNLRYLIPFGKVVDAINAIKDGINTMFDDGEKFGLWPKTHEHCYLDGWLKEFFNAIKTSNIKVLLPKEVIKSHRPKGVVYLQTDSYEEMCEWSLPAKTIEKLEGIINSVKQIKINHLKLDCEAFIKGGHWRNFLSKYSEANQMHKRMLHISKRVRKLNTVEAKKPLFKGQCNCPYWHGVFGGLYLPHLRHANYRNLIEADRICDRYQQPPKKFNVFDFDSDGSDEAVFESGNYFAVIHTMGASMVELDVKSKGYNVLNVITRRFEAYHNKLKELKENENKVATIHDIVREKEPGLKNRLFYDWYRRASFIEHFLHPDTNFDSFTKCQYGEQGDCVTEPYTIKRINSNTVTFFRDAHVWIGNIWYPLYVEKTFSIDKKITSIHQLKLTKKGIIKVRYGVEFNFAFLKNPGQLNLPFQDSFVFEDSVTGITYKIKCSNSMNLWVFPVETISNSEEGFERTYQGSCILFFSDIEVDEKGYSITFDIDFE